MPVFRKDPCGIICLMMTYLAVFYADFVVVRWIIIETLHSRFKPNFIVKLFYSLLTVPFSCFFSLWGAFHAVAFNIVVLLLTMAHLRAVFSDPGIVPLPQSKLDFAELHTGSKSE